MSILWKFCMVNKMNKNTFAYKFYIMCALFIIMLILFIFNILYGPVKIHFKEIIHILSLQDSTMPSYQILAHVRLPRAIAAILSGMALSTAGVILQALMDNPLAGPNVIGVNAGAGLSALIIIILFPHYYFILPLVAFLGAFFTSCIIFIIAYKTGASRIAIILAGVAISSFLSSGINTLTIIFPERVIAATSYMIGGFSGVTFEDLRFTIIYLMAAMVITILLSSSLNILSLGDEIALTLGMNVTVYRFIFIALASLLAGCAVSFSGLLGFVGLIIPHASRFIIGTDNRYLIPVSALMGACFVMVCDLIARNLFTPFEFPVGVIISFFGGPFFIWLLLKQKRRGLHD